MKHWISRNLFIVTLVSLAQDAASDLLYPLLPYIITAGVIGAAPIALGFIEGCAEAAAGIGKLLTGRASDYRGRKPFIVTGYFLAGIGKALIIFATIWQTAFLGRVTDRIGKGIRSSARDALISDSVEPQYLGRAFGFHRTGDNIGAVVGPLLALLALGLFKDNVGAVAKWALIPAAISGLLTLFIRETVKKSDVKRADRPAQPQLNATTKKLIAILVAIQITNIPDAFLLLRLYDLHFTVQSVVLIYAAYNLVAVLFAYPAGVIVDRLSPSAVYGVGLIAFTAGYLILGTTQSHGLAIIGFLIYGFFPPLTDGVGKAWIASHAAENQRGRAQGVYQSSMNFAVLAAGLWGGALWSKGTTQPALILAATGAALGAIFFLVTFFRENFSHRS